MNTIEKALKREGYAELLCDFMFKRLFGSEANKDVLIGFLNVLLEDCDIVDVDFIPTEHLGLTDEDRKVVFDISCKSRDGSTFIIEMQKGVQRHFRKRALYYTTYPINEQGRDARDLYIKDKAEGKVNTEFKWDYNLKPVIVVAILNFRFEHEDGWPADGYRSSYRIWEDTHHELMTDALRFVFLELRRFNKRIDELVTTADKWTYLLKHMHEMKEIPEEFSEPTFQRLFMLAEIGNFTADEYKMYINSLKNMGDFTNIINTAAENAKHEGLIEGIAIGRAEGRAEGEATGVTKVARQMLLMGMDTDTIGKATGLTPEQIEALREE